MPALKVEKFLFPERNFMAKLDMKDAYFSAPLHQSSKKYVNF